MVMTLKPDRGADHPTNAEIPGSRVLTPDTKRAYDVITIVITGYSYA
jgi:hypothetical protein